MQFKKIIGRAGGIRLAVAFVAGLLFGLIAAQVGMGLQNLLPYLLFPLLIGVAGAFTVRATNPHPYLVALATSLVGWAGISLYLTLLAARTPRSCSVGVCTVDVLKDLLSLYLAVGFVLVALASMLTSTTLRYYYLRRESRS
jgi:hypothetical protein